MERAGPDAGPRSPPGPTGSSAADRLWWYRDMRQAAPPARPDRRRARRRQYAFDALACLSISALCFSQARRETLFGVDWNFYNQIPLGVPTLRALILNLVALGGAGFLMVRVLRRCEGAACRLGAVAAGAILLISLNYARLAHETLRPWVDAMGRPGLLAIVVLVLAVSFAWPRPALRAIRGIALVVSPLAVVTFAHALWMFLEVTAGPVWRTVDPAPLPRSAPSLRRVVWVVFEGLDQRLVFEARPGGLELPELDRLRRESLYADGARPPAGTTEVSMPALITGRPVVAVAPTSPNELELTFADGTSALWSAQPNVFSRARAIGYETALIGWQLPYPRVLGASLGAAAWRPSVTHEQARGHTVGDALANQWGSLAPPAHGRRLLVQRYTELGDLALRAATDGRFGLVLLHLPVPSPPGIYDRATGRLTTWNFTGADGGYLDNLALADRWLGDLRRGLERARLGDRTWLVVTSDRWWRTPPGGRPADHRVPFLLRPPGGGAPTHVDGPLNTVATQDLVLAILRGSVGDTRAAAAWLSRQGAPPPKAYTPLGRPIY